MDVSSKEFKNLLFFQEDLVGQPHQMDQEDPIKCEKYLVSNQVLFYRPRYFSKSRLKPIVFFISPYISFLENFCPISQKTNLPLDIYRDGKFILKTSS